MKTEIQENSYSEWAKGNIHFGGWIYSEHKDKCKWANFKEAKDQEKIQEKQKKLFEEDAKIKFDAYRMQFTDEYNNTPHKFKQELLREEKQGLTTLFDGKRIPAVHMFNQHLFLLEDFVEIRRYYKTQIKKSKRDYEFVPSPVAEEYFEPRFEGIAQALYDYKEWLHKEYPVIKTTTSRTTKPSKKNNEYPKSVEKLLNDGVKLEDINGTLKEVGFLDKIDGTMNEKTEISNPKLGTKIRCNKSALRELCRVLKERGYIKRKYGKDQTNLVLAFAKEYGVEISDRTARVDVGAKYYNFFEDLFPYVEKKQL